MKILHTVEAYLPTMGGMPEVVRQISEYLAAKGHEVTVVTQSCAERTDEMINGVRVLSFDITGNMVRGFIGDIDAYRNFLLNSHFDVITNFAAQQWATDIALPLLDQIKGVKVFVPTGFSSLYSPQYSDYFEKMKYWLDQYDMNIFLSNKYRDINFARNAGIKKIMVIPNGASQDDFSGESTFNIRKTLGISHSTFLIIHVGKHTGLKGHDEAINIFLRAKIKDAILVIVADDFHRGCGKSCLIKKKFFSLRINQRLKRKKLLLSALTRDEVIAIYKEADLFLFPSRVECSPIVLFECLASKTPFLTTDVGNAEEIIEWTQGGIILPTLKYPDGLCRADIDHSARLVENLYHSPSKLKEIGERGYKAWQERFTWDLIVKEYEVLYERLLTEKRSNLFESG